ncbi:DUF1800 domain-containing protein [Mucilaginibacter lappiensis]|uniref:Uncharacterized protein (DUF1800 family) n=1 Tax=Mucilaginibacter lappiensis TaxID=354630 RepID=A0A841JEG6_9SPHI|nr:DUF1800 domain-containing protein [Mucilaginibacter lappiensis]MBB6126481.1 uncharacterized protein (DUF1800 family) [Mucilaginibacter lappiensis]
MKKVLKICYFAALMTGGLFLLTSFLTSSSPVTPYQFPYKHAGLTERQAAEHLLDRFTYGATPAQIDQVIKMGLENWFSQQLNAEQPDDSLNKRLNSYDAINLSNTEVCREYPPGFVIRSMAIKDSVISKDSVDKAVDKKTFNAKLQAYMNKKGFKSDQDLYKQFIDQNILRAAYTNNQLQEVLTDFWFNHFNVSFFKGECAQFIPAYERDIIRPNSLGKFDQMLMASAKSPAMLYYLDNFTSVGPVVVTPPKIPVKAAVANGDISMMMSAGNAAITANKVKTLTQPGKNVNGLNENYAREVMELHTLGVDGGYTQQDVTQAARVLTGWTIYPISDQAYGSNMKGLVAKIGENNLAKKGYIHEGDFLFTPNRHDQGEKVVLGHIFPSSTDPTAGYQEGVSLLEMLAHHPSTAKFICKKLAVRFVSDNPPQSLIKKMAKSFTAHDGDIKQVLITMVNSREFWDKKALLTKTKSPFELAISAVRGLNADIKDPYQLFNWISKMGEKIYYYQAPTGFPDRGQYWINTGALLNRMDFSLALTSGQISGVKVDLNNCITHQQPADAENTIMSFSKLLLPEQNADQMAKELSPFLNAPGLAAKMNNTAQLIKQVPVPTMEKPMAGAPGDMMLMSAVIDNKPKPTAQEPARTIYAINNNRSNTMQALAAGIIIGSPEFQKR